MGLHCGRRMYLFIYTFISIGLIIGLLYVMWSHYKHFLFLEVSDQFPKSIIIYLHCIFFFWFYALHAAFCAKKFGLNLLGFFYVVLAICSLLGSFYLWSAQNEFIDKCSDTWYDTKKDHSNWRSEIMKELNCTGFNKTNPPDGISCRVALNEFVGGLIDFISYSFIFFSFVLLIGALICFVYAFTSKPKLDTLNADQPLITTG